jgi:hypothetical protein
MTRATVDGLAGGKMFDRKLKILVIVKDDLGRLCLEDATSHRICRFLILITMLAASVICVTAQTEQPRSEAKQKSVPAENTQPKSADSSSAQDEPQTTTDDKWHFQVSPYLWIAGINGRAGVNDLIVDVDSGLTDDNVHLNAGFMATFEARRNRLIFLTDLQYSNLGTERPTPGPLFSDATAEFKTFILDPEVGYRVAANQEKGRSLDLLAGIRIWHLRANLELDPGRLSARSGSRSKNWVDAVFGARGRYAVTKKIVLVGKADLGGGGSEFTYQLFGGAAFNVSRHISLIGAYRLLHVDYDKDNFLFDMSLTGPVLGVGFRF